MIPSRFASAADGYVTSSHTPSRGIPKPTTDVGIKRPVILAHLEQLRRAVLASALPVELAQSVLELALQLRFPLCSFLLPFFPFYKCCYHKHFFRNILDTKLFLDVGFPGNTTWNWCHIRTFVDPPHFGLHGSLLPLKIFSVLPSDCICIKMNMLILY